MHPQWRIIILIIPCALDDKRAASLRWCGQRFFLPLRRFSFVKWYFRLSVSSSRCPLTILTLRIIHRSGLKSKIHKRFISSSFSLSLRFFLFRLLSISVTLSFSSSLSLSHTHICFAFHIPFSFSSRFSLHVSSRRQSTRFYRRLYVNSVICKNDRQKCSRGVHFKDP